MKCFSKSTRSFARIAAALVVWAIASTPALGAQVGPSGAGDQRVRDAIVLALEHRMGPGIVFDVTDLLPALASPIDGPLAVTFDSSVRLGGQMRFLLGNKSRSSRTRVEPIGEATAVVRARGLAVRATRNLTHGDLVGPDDVASLDGDLGSALVRRLPSLDEVVGARLLRDVREDGVVADTAVAGVPSVRSGDRVRVMARVAGVEVSSFAIAAQSGAVNQIIHVVNPETRRNLRARVVGRGEVEVINGR